MKIEIKKITLESKDLRTQALLLFCEKVRPDNMGDVLELISAKELHLDFINNRYERIDKHFGIEFLEFLHEFFTVLRQGVDDGTFDNDNLFDDGSLRDYLQSRDIEDKVKKGEESSDGDVIELKVELGPDDGRAVSLLFYATNTKKHGFIMDVVSMLNNSSLLDDFRRSRYENIVERFGVRFVKHLIKFYILSDDKKEAKLVAQTADLILNNFDFDIDNV